MATFALLGFGPMAQALSLQALEHDHEVLLWNRTYEKVETFVKEKNNKNLHAKKEIQEIIQALPTPRILFLLVQAGPAVDEILGTLLPLLTPRDIIADLGNSHYKDTEKRQALCRAQNIELLSVGISGGILGARDGAAFMVSGQQETYLTLAPILQSLSKDTTSVHYLGEAAEGHCVKMVHNGIEYAHMDVLRLSFDILHGGLSWSGENILELFREWQRGSLQSFLLERVCTVLKEFKDGPLSLENIRPILESKGTALWMTQIALEKHISLPMISRAVEQRVTTGETSLQIPLTPSLTIPSLEKLIQDLPRALEIAETFAFLEGLTFLSLCLPTLSLKKILLSWESGCIISGKILTTLLSLCEENISVQELTKKYTEIPDVIAAFDSIKTVIQGAVGFSLPLGSFGGVYEKIVSTKTNDDGIRVLAATRDAFGAHGIPLQDGTIAHGTWVKKYIT